MISLASLKKCLDSLAQPGSGARRRRRRPRRRRQPASTPGTEGVPQPLPQRTRARRSRSGNQPTPGLTQGEVVLARSERVQDVTNTGVGVVFHPSSFPWLKNLAKAFDLYRWLSVTLEYRPLVGSTTAGAVALGFDWSAKTVPTVEREGRLEVAAAPTRDGILACSPCYDGPVWQRATRMSLPAARLQQVRWFDLTSTGTDSAPGYFSVIATGTADKAVVGEVWAHYKVVLAGTRKV